MKTSDFDYFLPEELIAQTPIVQRDHARLLCLDKQSGEIAHRHFFDIVELMDAGDALILNTSKVFPARLLGEKKDTHGFMEFLLLAQRELDVWEVLVRPGRRAKVGARFLFGQGLLEAEVLEVVEGGNRLVKFFYDGDFFTLLDEIGNMPLPPYITEQLKEKNRYQTVYAKEIGSAAAPTAGLHFTPELLQKLQDKGVHIGHVVLHVGLGTFRPMKVENVEQHKMHSEHYEVPIETAQLIEDTKAAGKRVIAVGTTSCRTLESVAAKFGEVRPDTGETDIFIYPGFPFRVLDGLITNFHLPQSTLIMLVSAFAGYEHTMNAYEIAVQERYRFFSFGDAMLIADRMPPNLSK